MYINTEFTVNILKANFHVVSTNFFDVIMMGEKFTTYFVRRNFDGKKIDVISMYFLQSNFDERKIDGNFMYFLQSNI